MPARAPGRTGPVKARQPDGAGGYAVRNACRSIFSLRIRERRQRQGEPQPFRLPAPLLYSDGVYVSFPDAPPPLEETGGPQAKDISGSALPGVSRWALSLGGECSHRATLASRTGELFGGVDTSYRSSFSSSASASRYLVVDGYDLLNARVAFRWAGGWSLSVWSRNLLDRKCLELLSAAPGGSGLYVGLPADPRTIGITLRMSLGRD